MIRLEVIGTPQPQGNKTPFVNPRTGKVALREGGSADASNRFHSWRDAVAHEARGYQSEHRLELLDEPVVLDITFRMPRPKSAAKRVLFPAVKPDLDKLQRSCLDALEGTLLLNDSRVVEIHARKVFAVAEPPGCVIVITLAEASLFEATA